jgi:hypothetical protein
MERIRLYEINEYKYAIIAAQNKENAAKIFYETIKADYNDNFLFSKNFIHEKLTQIDFNSPAYNFYRAQITDKTILPQIIIMSD